MQCGPGSKANTSVIADVKVLGALQQFRKEVIAFPDGARISLRSNINRLPGLIYASTLKMKHAAMLGRSWQQGQRSRSWGIAV